jgi:hypothetical protein
MNRTVAVTLGLVSAFGLLLGASTPASAKDLIEYFQPTPIVGSLSSSAWGAAAVGPRDTQNGLEDATMKNYCYWDGQIMRGPDGKYHMYASRWAQSKGHSGWGGSVAVHAISTNVIGPYVDQGMAYTDSNGKGHNVTASMLPDNTWTVIVSDTRPGDIFLSNAIDGPWSFKGSITVNANGLDSSGTTKNLSLVILPDKSYLMATRFGTMMTTPSNLLGPWTVQAAKVFTSPAGYPSGSREDPVIWCSGGQYHLVYNYYDLRKARHMVSPDGIKNWKDMGLAYDPTANFIRYTDGTVNHWYKLERPGVFLENGHVSAFTFAAIDVDKASELGNDTHGSKVIVVPFDGATFDTDTGVAGNACSTYSANSGVPSTGSTGGASGTGGTGGTGGSTGGTTARDAGPSDSALPKDTGAGGASGGSASGGTVVTGGTTVTSGTTATGGNPASGGTTATGGNTASGGTTATGGRTASGGTTAAGGKPASGGTTATGGNTASGGSSAVGSTGGTTTATGGTAPTSTGGATATGGLPTTGGTAQPSAGGSVASTGGASGTTVTNASSSGCAFAPGPGARHPMSIAWAFAFACGLAWRIRSRRRR